MKRILRIWERAVVLVLFSVAGAHAEDFYSSVLSDATYALYENSVVHANAYLGFDVLVITAPLFLENRGTIANDIHINAGKELSIKNSGKILGDVLVSDYASLTQVITVPADLNRVEVVRNETSSFAILADNARDVGFMDLVSLARDADKIVLKDSVLHFNYGDRSHVPVEIMGEIVFLMDDISGLDDREILAGVFGDGAIFIKSDIPNLFYAETEISDNSVILRVNRETDYAKVIGGNKGIFLNQVRSSHANNKLLARLDAATSGAELNLVMNKSAMFNPVRLMDPLRALFRFAHVSGFAHRGPGIGVATMFGNGISVYATGTSVDFSDDNFSFGINANVGIFDGHRNWSDNSGLSYGGGAYAAFYNEKFFISMTAGMNHVDFETADPVFDGKGAVYNPTGLGLYGTVESGVRLLNEGVYVEPMVRMNL